MEQRSLGASGIRVSLVGLGCNNFGGAGHSAEVRAYGSLDHDATAEVVRAALDVGVTLFDTADIYGQGGSERSLGRILAPVRSEVVIATKWGSGLPEEARWGSRAFLRRALEGSLRRLGTDYVDLYQLHWPDPQTPLAETLGALDELVVEGKIRAHGSSHFDGQQIIAADGLAREHGWAAMASAQNHFNLLERSAEADVLPACRETGVGLLPYFPLASGLLTGKYSDGHPDQSRGQSRGRLAGQRFDRPTLDRVAWLDGFARERGRTLLELAVSGLAARSEVSSVITGATRPEQIRANAEAAAWTLSTEDVHAVFSSHP